jgi:hypothetical protein
VLVDFACSAEYSSWVVVSDDDDDGVHHHLHKDPHYHTCVIEMLISGHFL